MSNELMELASRVEALSGPDEEVDGAIAAILWQDQADAEPRSVFDCFQPYTASIDAAMTLLSEGWWLYMVDGSITGRLYASLRGPLFQCVDPECEELTIRVPAVATGTAKSLQLALCAAALRASSTLSTGDEK